MSTEQNKAFIRRFFAAFSGKDKPAELLAEYVADMELKQHIAFFEAAFPRYEIIAEDIIAEGDRVAVRAFIRGVHQGEFIGIPPTGKTISNSGISIYRIADGKIIQHWMQNDAMGLMQQLTGTAEAQTGGG